MRRMQCAEWACRTCTRACIAVELARSSSGHVQTASVVLNGSRSAARRIRCPQATGCCRSRQVGIAAAHAAEQNTREGGLFGGKAAAHPWPCRLASGDAPGDTPGGAAHGIDDAAADAGLGDPEGWRFRSASQRTKRLALRDVLQVSDAWHQLLGPLSASRTLLSRAASGGSMCQPVPRATS